MAVEVGLLGNLKNWRLAMSNARKFVDQAFDPKAFDRFNRGARASQARLRAGFNATMSGIARMFRSKLARLGAMFAAVFAVRKIFGWMTGGIQKSREFSDSLTALEQSLEAVGLKFDRVDAEKFAGKMRLAAGIAETEVIKSLSILATSGIQEKALKPMAALAANIARSTGKDIESVTRKVAEAASGQLRALKELGIIITPTGDHVRDALAAVTALQAKYGGLAQDMLNPSQRLNANLEAIQRIIGERLLVYLDPLIQRIADFTAGLMESEEGRAVLEGIATWLGRIIQFFVEGARAAAQVGKILRAMGKVVWAELRLLGAEVGDFIFNGAKQLVFRILKFLASEAREILGDRVMKLLGMGDVEQRLGEAIRRSEAQRLEATRPFRAEAAGAMEGLAGEVQAYRDLMAGRAGPNWFERMAEQGREIREQAQGEMAALAATPADESFVGRKAFELRAQELEKAREKQRKALRKRMERDADKLAPVEVGRGTRIVIQTRENPRFMRGRT